MREWEIESEHRETKPIQRQLLLPNEPRENEHKKVETKNTTIIRAPPPPFITYEIQKTTIRSS